MSLIAYLLAIVGFVMYWFGVGDFGAHDLLGFSFTCFVLGHVLPGDWSIPRRNRAE